MLTLHHLNDSRSQRVLWLLEELGLPYQVERYRRDAGTRLRSSVSRRLSLSIGEEMPRLARG